MKVLIVGEGKNEEESLPAIVTRLANCDIECDFRKVTDTSFTKIHGKGKGFFKKALGWIRQATRENYDALVFLIDEDGDSSRITQINEAQTDITFKIQRACAVAVKTYDAWFLADERALTRILHTTVQRQMSPENNPDPKSHCIDLATQESSINGLSDFYSQVAGVMDMQVVKNRCPRGFCLFADRVEALATP